MKRNKWVIPASIISALILQIMPMPVIADLYRPDWVLLILCYWCMALPNRVGIGVACLCGFTLDVLYGTALGVHSFALIIPIFVVIANYQRFRNYSVFQQLLLILMLGSLYHIIIYWLLYWITGVDFRADFLWPVITSAVLWPWLFWLLRRLRQSLRVS